MEHAEKADRTGADKSPCRVCHEPIVKGAQKCIHCNSFQNWRQYLNIGSGILSLLVALISVLTVGVPVFKSALTAKKPEVHFSLLKYEEKTIQILGSNLGNRSGILKAAKLRIFLNDEEVNETKGSPISLKWDQQNPIIKPNESKLFGLYYEIYGDRQKLKSCSNSIKSCGFHIAFEIIEPNNKSTLTEKKFSCAGCEP